MLLTLSQRVANVIVMRTLTVATEIDLRLADPFWGHVAIGEPDECWEWDGNRFQSGYGQAWVPAGTLLPGLDGRIQQAHRVAYLLASKRWPGRMFVCHTCDNPPCVNPAHLWLGTAAENNRDRDAKGRGRSGSNRTPAEVEAEVREAVAEGRKISHLAREFGISRMTIYRIIGSDR